MKKFIAVFFALCASVTIAAPMRANCNNASVAFEGVYAVLNVQDVAKPFVYRLQNISNTPVVLGHFSKNAGMNAGWSSQLNPGNISAAMITQKHFYLTCNIAGKGPVACSDVIGICEMTKVQYPAKAAQGQYWIVENRAPAIFQSAMAKRGFQ